MLSGSSSCCVQVIVTKRISCSAEDSTTFYTGVSVGASVVKRLSENGPHLAFDYAFRPTHRPDNGVHNFSLRFMLNKKRKAACRIIRSYSAILYLHATLLHWQERCIFCNDANVFLQS